MNLVVEKKTMTEKNKANIPKEIKKTCWVRTNSL